MFNVPDQQGTTHLSHVGNQDGGPEQVLGEEEGEVAGCGWCSAPRTGQRVGAIREVWSGSDRRNRRNEIYTSSVNCQGQLSCSEKVGIAMSDLGRRDSGVAGESGPCVNAAPQIRVRRWQLWHWRSRNSNVKCDLSGGVEMRVVRNVLRSTFGN